MIITWFGQSCFRLAGKDANVLIDPFSKEIGLKPPRINDQIVLKTHDHIDHNNLEGAGPETFVIGGPGEYEKLGVSVTGIESYHDNEKGAKRGSNTIYMIHMDEMMLCHLGDIGQKQFTQEQLDAINWADIDILFVPVGGTYTVNAAEAVELVKEIEPKIIIPMHYKIPGLSIELDDVKKFTKEIGIKPEEVDVLKINVKQLPQEETKLIVFKR
ncbi:MAG: Zn-dependent hydrolase [Parcubacteria group bacterium Licking1014_17]|nr:MAG: Zn-dependent hydrolase [Parcubacteria group bacterium Licking1014_17]